MSSETTAAIVSTIFNTMSDEHDPIQVLYRRSGKPLADRSETISVVKALHGDETPSESSSSSTKKQLPSTACSDKELS
jgi:hypothetical protein